jgi:hypothetical protein
MLPRCTVGDPAFTKTGHRSGTRPGGHPLRPAHVGKTMICRVSCMNFRAVLRVTVCCLMVLKEANDW